MSHFANIVTKITHLEYLVKAIVEIFGIQPLIYETERPLVGFYQHSQGFSAHVVIPAALLGTNADIGFRKTEQGTYELIWDKYEFTYGRARLKGLSDLEDRISAEYAKHKTLAALKNNNLRMKRITGCAKTGYQISAVPIENKQRHR